MPLAAPRAERERGGRDARTILKQNQQKNLSAINRDWRRQTDNHCHQHTMASTTAAKFLWKKNGPKPEANKKLDETSWLLGTTLNLAANNLDVTFKAGSRDYGLSASNADGKISELSLKKKYA